VNVTWIGHSTVLFEADGVHLLTDPQLRPRFAHVVRVAEPAAEIAGELDAVLVSHVHSDHLDVRSIRQLSPRRLVVPRGAGRLLRLRGFTNVTEVEAEEELAIGSVSVRVTRADHRASFGPLLPAVSLGFVVSADCRVYFAGDTDVFPEMADIGTRDNGHGLDAALLPIAGWGPRVGKGHLDPQRAADALRLLRPRLAIPIHWGTYRRVGLPRDEATLREPVERFVRLAAELAPDVEVRVLSPGEGMLVEPSGRAGGIE
jgi:L-ascorbate metabolism protein UlaG (beta-lactamase superfamily)